MSHSHIHPMESYLHSTDEGRWKRFGAFNLGFEKTLFQGFVPKLEYRFENHYTQGDPMKIQSSYRVFFAFPFDPAIRPMYERIMAHLKTKYEDRFDFLFGNSSVIEPCPKFLKYEMFKEQNTDLLNQFLSNIESCDVVVADLTYNNPNVHVELGIAISLRKNILRVSGRTLIEIGSDVRGYEIHNYSNEEDLRNKIQNYLEQYLSIKELPLSKEAGPFYSLSFPEDKDLRPGEYIPIGAAFRDGAVKMKFRFKYAESNGDWFGIFFRQTHGNPWLGGYLLYVRENGSLELVDLPNVGLLNKRDYGEIGLETTHTIQFAVDGSRFRACLDDKIDDCLETENLKFQSYGYLGVFCFKTEATFSSVEAVCRDTISFSS